MQSYRFRYYHGQSAPYMTIEATDDADFYAKRDAWKKKSGFKHVPHTIVCTMNKTRRVSEPESTTVEKALNPGEYNLDRAKQDGIRMPGMSVLEG